MLIRNDTAHWGAISIGLHWLTVVLIVGLATIGLLLDEVPKTPRYFWIFDAHKSTGLLVLGLVIVRLLWRLIAGAPEPVPGMPRWQVWAANATHGLLYVVLLAMPLSGWLYDSASGFRPLKWFGLFTMPRLSGRDAELKQFALDAHETLFYLLALLVLLHAAAALKHHYLDRDPTLRRMWPWAKVPNRPLNPP